MYLTKPDLITHIRAENIEKITRATDAIVTDAIDSAVGEARSYLSRYDTVALFGSIDGLTDPSFQDAMLKRKVKDIAAWNLVTGCNANVDLELFEAKYKQAITYLRDVQKGMAEPAGWPVHDASTNPPNIGDSIAYAIQPKRINNY